MRKCFMSTLRFIVANHVQNVRSSKWLITLFSLWFFFVIHTEKKQKIIIIKVYLLTFILDTGINSHANCWHCWSFFCIRNISSCLIPYFSQPHKSCFSRMLVVLQTNHIEIRNYFPLDLLVFSWLSNVWSLE